jgi:DNA invertase Pin-like site-specific DNA recombinase
MDKTEIVKRCAIYTRKSSEEGLEQSFNSLHAQREACEAFVSSQRHEGWSTIPSLYDDGGFSGGNMERPGLKSLLRGIVAGQIEIVVVYKIDRLTRSLLDFAKIVETFDAHKVSFVSVTQSFNTTTSMGRLTLNVLLSFAQFEREVTSERIRDKVTASKKRGMWMGGNIPLGYDLKDHTLVINEREAGTITTIFQLYAELGAVRKVKAELDRLDLRTKLQRPASGFCTGGLPFRVGHIYSILRNHLYRGKVHHKGEFYPGDHSAIIDQELWDRVQMRLASNATVRPSGKTSREPSLFAGLLYDGRGNRMTPTHAVKNGKRYRYYISNNLIAGANAGRESKPGNGLRIAAKEIEGHVVTRIARFLTDPPKLVSIFGLDGGPSAASALLQRARRLADQLRNPAEDCDRTIRALIVRIEVSDETIRIELNRDALTQRLEVVSGDTAAVTHEALKLDLRSKVCRLGKEKRLIVAAHLPASNPDAALIKAIVHAHHWFEMLKNRETESITDLAKREGMPRTYVGSIVPFALLAPDITEAILDGRQPVGLTLDRLLATSPLPISWSQQRLALGFG